MSPPRPEAWSSQLFPPASTPIPTLAASNHLALVAPGDVVPYLIAETALEGRKNSPSEDTGHVGLKLHKAHIMQTMSPCLRPATLHARPSRRVQHRASHQAICLRPPSSRRAFIPVSNALVSERIALFRIPLI